jgi:hypothetical protein
MEISSIIIFGIGNLMIGTKRLLVLNTVDKEDAYLTAL